MKNQYFADKRDFVKYELLMDLAEGLPNISRLTVIPMLTVPDQTGEGRFVKYGCGNRRPDLHSFLNGCLQDGRRDIRCLEEFLGGRGFQYRLCCDASLYFRHEGRDTYFASVPDNLLESAVVFLDPDIGLPPREDKLPHRRNLHKYLLWEDVARLAVRTPGSSVLVIYQHLQLDKRRIWDDIEHRGRTLCRRLAIPSVCYVTDTDVAFFIASRCNRRNAQVLSILQTGQERHGLDCGTIVEDMVKKRDEESAAEVYPANRFSDTDTDSIRISGPVDPRERDAFLAELRKANEKGNQDGKCNKQ